MHMKISTKVEYGIIAMIDIAVHSENGEAVTVSSISGRHSISGKYLEQVLTALRQADLIRGLKGSRGGYIISGHAEKITFKQIINALDVTVLGDVYFDSTPENSVITDTLQSCLWNKMTSYLRSFSESVTLEDIADEYRRKNENQVEDYSYCI